MAITRQVSKLVTGFVGTYQSASTWSPATTGSTAHIVENATTYYGQIVDRLELGANFGTVDLGFCLSSTHGSTMTGNSTPLGMTVDAWLLHGDSSGGGDLAAISEPASYGTKRFWTTLDTTDMQKASTWMNGGQTSTMALNPGVTISNPYDLNGAKRYLCGAFSISKPVTTTCTDKAETGWVNLSYVFRDGDKYPPDELKLWSTSTATST